jgi:glutamate-1-semialdehyde 2,1-aminomutase
VPESTREEFIILPWNDLELLKQTIAANPQDIAAVITEPIMCNNGCILPSEGFLQGLRNVCTEFGITLIFDEVITGFRMGLGGAQKYFGITPDLSIFAKAFANGYPISAIVGKREWMTLVEQSLVIHAGTMNSSNPTVAAALATIQILEQENPYERLFSLGKQLMNGLRDAATKNNKSLLVQGPGPMFSTTFTHLNTVKDYRDTLAADRQLLSKFIAGMHDKGIRIIGRGLWYISAAHTEQDISKAINTAGQVLSEI